MILSTQYQPLSFLPRVTVLLLAVTFFAPGKVKAQDPQFSQYYAAPLYLNPGLTGINQMGRAGLNYRNQWPSIDANFETYSFYVDYFFEDQSSGVGLLVNADREGLAGLRSNSIGLQYAYQVRLNQNWTFRPGAEVAYYWRDINFSELTFGDQFDESGQVRNVTGEAFDTGLNSRFFDMSLGGVVFNQSAWFGASMHHVLEPNQSLSGGESPLYRKFSLHGGYKIPFTKLSRRARLETDGRERSMTPSVNYKQQGEFKQLDLGMYVTLEPVLLGVWYRGIPIQGFENTKNAESAVMMVGFNTNNLTIGYSFDYVISDLGIGSGGAHEISLIYAFSFADPRKPSREVRELRCPVPFLF